MMSAIWMPVIIQLVFGITDRERVTRAKKLAAEPAPADNGPRTARFPLVTALIPGAPLSFQRSKSLRRLRQAAYEVVLSGLRGRCER